MAARINRILDARGPWFQFIDLGRIEYNRVELGIPGLPPPLQGLRILHLTDLHCRPHWMGGLDGLLQRIQDNPPDLLLITGDFVDSKVDPTGALPFVKRFVEGLTARMGIFATSGNHDGDLIATHLHDWGITVLERRWCSLCHKGSEIELIGLPGVERVELTREQIDAIPARKPDSLRIVLSHFPDAILNIAKLEPDIVLAGHTHGGQVCLPGGTPILKHSRLPRHLCTGIHRVEKTWLVANRGLGFSTWQIRMFCPAEAIELVLARDESV